MTTMPKPRLLKSKFVTEFTLVLLSISGIKAVLSTQTLASEYLTSFALKILNTRSVVCNWKFNRRFWLQLETAR